MRTVSIPKERLKEVFIKQKTATMKQLKNVLKTNVSMTVYRKLEELNFADNCLDSNGANIRR